MPEKESFISWLHGKLNSALMSDDESKAIEKKTIARMRAEREGATLKNYELPESPPKEDDIGEQVALLRKKRKVFSMGSSDEPK